MCILASVTLIQESVWNTPEHRSVVLENSEVRVESGSRNSSPVVDSCLLQLILPALGSPCCATWGPVHLSSPEWRTQLRVQVGQLHGREANAHATLWSSGCYSSGGWWSHIIWCCSNWCCLKQRQILGAPWQASARSGMLVSFPSLPHAYSPVETLPPWAMV